MNDDLGLFDEERDPPRTRSPEQVRARRRITWLGSGVIIAVIVLVGWFGVRELLGIGGFPDYSGEGTGSVLVQVSDGQSQRSIAEELAQKDVVASSDAFVAAGKDNRELLAIQPGYYIMRHHMSGEAAVQRITSPAARTGNLQIKAGTRLQDVHQPGGGVVHGVFSLLSQASCANVDGHSTCVSTQQLRHVAETANLRSLGVPDWAASAAAKVPPEHRLEGLILPGVYQVKPGDDAQQLLKSVLTNSAAEMSAAGLPGIASGTRYTPYQTLVIASLVQSEGVEKDFGKISRVIHNRLAQHHRLELDSTVNYVLDRPEIRTTQADREKAGPYNTYANATMPPSPIASPSKEAITAAADPTPGPWMYFVKCEKDGTSCFARTSQEHQQNVDSARKRGVF